MKEIDDIVRLYEATAKSSNQVENEAFIWPKAELSLPGSIDEDGYKTIYYSGIITMHTLGMYTKGKLICCKSYFVDYINSKPSGHRLPTIDEWEATSYVVDKDFHRENDKPARITKTYGTLMWYKNGINTRGNDLPCKISNQTGKEWRDKDGKLDRGNDMPAELTQREAKWYKSDRLFRKNGPACLFVPYNETELSDENVVILKDDYDYQIKNGSNFFINGKDVSTNEYVYYIKSTKLKDIIKGKDSTMMDVLCAFGDL